METERFTPFKLLLGFSVTGLYCLIKGGMKERNPWKEAPEAMYAGIHGGKCPSERNWPKKKSLEKPKPETAHRAFNAACAQLELYGKQTSYPHCSSFHKPVGLCPQPAHARPPCHQAAHRTSREVSRDAIILYLKLNSQKSNFIIFLESNFKLAFFMMKVIMHVVK